MYFSVPENDSCDGAIEVTSLPILFKDTNKGATPDFTALAIDTCGVNWNTRGVWYNFIGSGAIVRLEYQLWSKANGYSQLSVFTGSCDKLVCVANVQGKAGGGLSPDFNALAAHEFLAEDGVSYRILLTGEKFDTSGDYEFKITEVYVPETWISMSKGMHLLEEYVPAV